MSTTEETTAEEIDWAAIAPNIDHIETEDDTPVDNMFSEKQQRLLSEPLYSSWPGPGDGRSFIVAANVGVFASTHQPPLVLDVFLSLDVKAPQDLWPKKNRSYFIWEYGKSPEVVIEIVSNKKGGEVERKLLDYARIGIVYYVIFDPDEQLRGGVLRPYILQGGEYVALTESWLQRVALGLTLWQGVFEGVEAQWLRWCDKDGTVIPTGAERAEHERARAERLAERLRALGIDPEEV